MPKGVVETAEGAVEGEPDGRAWVWRSLPYARPPVGPLRFRPPEAHEPWTGVRPATRFGPAAMQRAPSFRGIRGDAFSEDCLTLNIWSPAADGRPRAVLVWVHGGAFVSGSGALYRGEPLAAGGDIVVVTLNYRLGVFGFANFADAIGDERFGGNLGLRDIVAALGWVRRNIAGFGGDPTRMTLAGESAGSIMVSLLMLSDLAIPLFDQAILQSGAYTLTHTRDLSRHVAAAYRDHIGRDVIGFDQWQALPASALLDAQAAVGKRLRGISPAAPWFDGVLLPASFAAARAKPTTPMPLLAGANRDEIVLFRFLPGPKILRTGRRQLVDLLRRDLAAERATAIERVYPNTREGNRALGSDVNFTVPTLHVAERHAARGGPTWVYRFDYAHPLLRACHALELLFLWPFPGILAAVLRGGFLTGLRSGLSDRMRAAWTGFVRTGSPGGDWPAYRLPERSMRLFALQDRVLDDPLHERRAAWDGADVEAGR